MTPPALLLVPPIGNHGSEAVATAYDALPGIHPMQVVRMSDAPLGVIREALRYAEEALVLYDTGYARSAKFRGAQKCSFLSGMPVRWAVGIRPSCHLKQYAGDKNRAANLLNAFFCNENFEACLERTMQKKKAYLPWGEMDAGRAKRLNLNKWEDLCDLNRWFRSPL